MSNLDPLETTTARSEVYDCCTYCGTIRERGELRDAPILDPAWVPIDTLLAHPWPVAPSCNVCAREARAVGQRLWTEWGLTVGQRNTSASGITALVLRSVRRGQVESVSPAQALELIERGVANVDPRDVAALTERLVRGMHRHVFDETLPATIEIRASTESALDPPPRNALIVEGGWPPGFAYYTRRTRLAPSIWRFTIWHHIVLVAEVAF